MNFINSCEKKSGDAVQLELNHPLKDRSAEEKYAYINALAAVAAAGNNAGPFNHKYIAAIFAEFGMEVEFEKLVSCYRQHPEKINIDIITATLKTNNCFLLLLVLDAAMIQPEIYAGTQSNVWDFLKKLHLRLAPEEKNQEWYPAIFGFAVALAKSKAAPEFLLGTTKQFYIPSCWTHILKFKGLLSDETAILPELCRVFTPGSVGAMFESGNFTTDENGELRLSTAAVFKQSCAAVEFLLSKGADINAADKGGMTFLNKWGILLSAEMFEFLLDHGVKVNSDTISFSFIMNEPEFVRSMMRHGMEIPARCIHFGFIHTEVARAYLENGGDPNLKDENGDSWIDTEILLDNKEMVALLKEFGAVPSPDARPLQEAADELRKYLEEEEGKTGEM